VTVDTIGLRSEIEYDILIVATGARQSYFGRPEFADDAPGMKTLDDALELRGRIKRDFEFPSPLMGEGRERVKMAAYVIGDIEVTEPAVFQEYRNRVGATVEQYGGKFVVRSGRVNLKEGDWQPRLLVMLEFPSLEQAERWYNSPEYKPLIAIREKAARTQLIIAEGT
jgi:uncharacterized protein (DUF1330 family)